MENKKVLIIVITAICIFISIICCYGLYRNKMKYGSEIANGKQYVSLTSNDIENNVVVRTNLTDKIEQDYIVSSLENETTENDSIETSEIENESIIEVDAGVNFNVDETDSKIQSNKINMQSNERKEESKIQYEVVEEKTKDYEENYEKSDIIETKNEISEEEIEEQEINNEQIEENKENENIIVVEPVKVKSIYDYEFDIQAIKRELISIGEAMGLTHIEECEGIKMTPSNSSWNAPITASKNFQGKNLEYALKDMVNSMPKLIVAYGGNKIDYFTIYVEQKGEYYTFYFLY